ncbi:MAG: pilin [Patescibacteria group bacterium]|jgi:hypothetical protein
MKLFKITLLGLVLGFNLFLPAISLSADSQTCDPSLTLEQCQRYILKTVGGGNQGYGDNTNISATTLAEKVGQVVGMVLSVFGVVFFGLVVYSGFQWMSAGGNEEWVTKAKDRIIRASIGLGIVMMSWALTTFIVSRFKVVAEQGPATNCHAFSTNEQCQGAGPNRECVFMDKETTGFATDQCCNSLIEHVDTTPDSPTRGQCVND